MPDAFPEFASTLHRHLLVVAFGGAVLFFFPLADIIVYAITTLSLTCEAPMLIFATQRVNSEAKKTQQ